MSYDINLLILQSLQKKKKFTNIEMKRNDSKKHFDKHLKTQSLTRARFYPFAYTCSAFNQKLYQKLYQTLNAYQFCSRHTSRFLISQRLNESRDIHVFINQEIIAAFWNLSLSCEAVSSRQ